LKFSVRLKTTRNWLVAGPSLPGVAALRGFYGGSTTGRDPTGRHLADRPTTRRPRFVWAKTRYREHAASCVAVVETSRRCYHSARCDRRQLNRDELTPIPLVLDAAIG